jgi:CHAT domain-containing protein
MLSSFHARLRVVVSWSCLLILVCSTVPHTASAQSPDDDAAGRKLVEQFFDYYQKRDLDALMALWSEKSPEFAARKQEFQQTFAANKIELRRLTIGKIEVNGGKARIRAVAEISAEDIKTGKAADGFEVLNRTFHVLREGEGWKVWQFVASEQELASALVSAKTDEERKAILAAEKELVTAELGRALLSEGSRLETQGAYAVALESYRLALSLAEQLHDQIGVASAFRNIGNVHNWQGNYTQALEHYRRSLKISEEIDDKRGIADTLNNIGNVHNSQGNYTQALEHHRRSLKISEEIGDKQGIAITLDNIGNVHYSRGNYSLAREELTKAIAAVEELRGLVAGDQQQQQQFFQTMLSPYRQMIRLSVDDKKHTEAFAYAERVKGRALLDTLEAGRVDITKAMTDDELAEERRLNAEVVSLNNRLYRENLRSQPDKALLVELQASRDKARASYEAFQVSLYAAHPELKIQRGQMTPVSLTEAGRLIPNPATAVLEYVVTDDFTYLFVLTKGQQPQAKLESSADLPALNVYTINIKQKELAERVGRLHGRLSQKDIDYSKPSRDLYDLLIGPARADLKNKTNLIVVPDGVLWQVPFQALQPSPSRFLIQDYTISYAPSLTVLREMMSLKQKRHPASGELSTLIAFGNPDFDVTTAANLQAIYPEVLADEKLLPLPQTEHLVKTLSRLYGPDRSKVYVRSEAREDRAKKEAGTCRILQFATHGILDDANPMYSRLVMSQSGVGEQEDGMLETWEVMKLDLNAEMVVLSACDTARGRVAGGEGMIGLAWAFFVAGCPTTVVSQWKVEVNSTNELMVEFHKKLKSIIEGRSPGVSKARALRDAMMKLMRNPSYRHPFYWAPFVVIGDSR